jgi:ribosomal protein S6
MQTSVEKKTVYELAFLLKTGETEAALLEMLAQFKAEITSKVPLTQIQLAYPIAKQLSAQFGSYQFKLEDATAMKELSHALGLKDYLVRFLFVKLPKTKPQAPRIRPVTGAAAPLEKKATTAGASVSRLDSLSNEKLEQTLEEILK